MLTSFLFPLKKTICASFINLFTQLYINNFKNINDSAKRNPGYYCILYSILLLYLLYIMQYTIIVLNIFGNLTLS